MTSARTSAGAVVGDLAEEELLELIQARLAPVARDAAWPAGTVPPGDDAAVLPAPRGAVAVSTDAMGEGTDFLMTWPAGVRTRGHDVGWKAAAQNLSDINAMGAAPRGLVTALTLPRDTPVAWVTALAGGFTAAIRALGAGDCRVAGGDLGEGGRVHVAVTALGDPPAAGAVRRVPAPAVRARMLAEGAVLVHAAGPAGPGWGRPGPGWAAAGLALLLTDRARLRERAAALDPADRPGARELARAVRAQLRPRPPLALGPAAAAAGIAALMDVSDGVGRDAHRIARATGTPDDPLTPWVDEAWLAGAAAPLVRVAALSGRAPEEFVLAGGEDYGLLGLVPDGGTVPAGFERIGRLEPAGRRPAGHRPLPERGWDHFGAAR